MGSCHRLRFVPALLLLLGAATCPAYGQDQLPPSDASGEAIAKELQALTKLVRLSRETAEAKRPLELHPSALLAYRDPTRERSDSRVWLATSEGEPAALLTVSLQPPGSPVERVFEVATLSDEPIVVERPPKEWRLHSRTPVWVPLPQAPAAAVASERLRTLQMKRLAERFQVRETQSQDGTHTLRLMPAPVYQASTEPGGVALFAFAYGTNPEAVVAIRYQQELTGAKWNYALAALTAAELTVTLDGKEVWTQPRFLGPHTRSRYVGASIPLNAVPPE